MKASELKQLIRECLREVKEEWEPYDAERDTFASAPRDRVDGEENDLGIPEFPQSIIKQHDLDGQQRWFVYSSSDPQALIIGWGKSSSDAIHNAKTTAKYIKHGGVGHTGELKEGDWPGPPRNKEWDVLQWAKKRLRREGNRLNRDTLERLVEILEKELKINEPLGPDHVPPRGEKWFDGGQKTTNVGEIK